MDENLCNICKFVPIRQIRNELNIINFVYEKQTDLPGMRIGAVHALHLVTAGQGMLHTSTHCFPLRAGDLFFKLPARQYRIENSGGLRYIYISYTGGRAAEFLERIRFDSFAPVYHGFSRLIPLWAEAVEAAGETNIDLMAEGVLLYTLSCLSTTYRGGTEGQESGNDMLRIKQYLDEHYTDPRLNLQTVSRRFSYDYKYVSRRFLQTVGRHFQAYLVDLRIANARRLMENGYISVKEIAGMSGFSDAFYFSKVFQKKTGLTPSACIRENNGKVPPGKRDDLPEEEKTPSDETAVSH